MSLLTDSDLTAMRTALDESLPETCVIQRSSYADDAGGGGTISWAASGTVDCRVAPIAGTEREIGNRLAEDASWVITLPALTTIDTDDRIVSGGRTFNVLALRAPRSYELSRRAEVNEVT